MKFNKDDRSEKFDYDGLKKAKHQYFAMEHLYNDKYSGKLLKDHIWLFMINIDKNVGKTFQMNQMMIDDYHEILLAYKNKKEVKNRFFMLYRTNTQLDMRKADINSNPNVPFMVKKNQIICKNNPDIVIGQCGSLSTLHNFNGDKFEGYHTIYFDEYRSKVPLSTRQKLSEYPKLGTFCDTFQRDKKKIRLIMFGNNEPEADIIAENFLISKNTSYAILKEFGIAYFNLGGLYKGLKDKGQKRAVNTFKHFNKGMSDFIEHNIAIESKKGLVDHNVFKQCRDKLEFIILYEGVHYHFYEKEEKYYCESLDIPLDATTYTILRQDNNRDANYVTMDINFASDIDWLYKNDKIFFWKVIDRDIMEEFLNKALSIVEMRDFLAELK